MPLPLPDFHPDHFLELLRAFGLLEHRSGYLSDFDLMQLSLQLDKLVVEARVHSHEAIECLQKFFQLSLCKVLVGLGQILAGAICVNVFAIEISQAE